MYGLKLPNTSPPTRIPHRRLYPLRPQTMSSLLPLPPHYAPPLPKPMSTYSPLRHIHILRRRLTISAAVSQPTTTFTSAPLATVSPAAESLFHVAVDVSDQADLASSYSRPGQYLQLRVPSSEKPSFLAIASPPSLTVEKGVFEFLVKDVAGSPAEGLCRLRKGDVVELTHAMGKGFDVQRIETPMDYGTVLIFATGSGISPIRSLIESGFGANKRSDVRLYYGARNLKRMAYQDRFKDWESTGIEVVPVLSQPDDSWDGERGYVQAAYARFGKIVSSGSAGAVLCGHKQMTEEVISLLLANGVSREKILMNF